MLALKLVLLLAHFDCVGEQGRMPHFLEEKMIPACNNDIQSSLWKSPVSLTSLGCDLGGGGRAGGRSLLRLSNLDKQGPTEGLGWKAKLRGSSSWASTTQTEQLVHLEEMGAGRAQW